MLFDLLTVPLLTAVGSYLLYITPRGIKGMIITKRINKGKLRAGKNYYPPYFTEDEAESYQWSVEWRLVLIISLAVMAIMVPKTIIVPVISILLIYKLGKKLLKIVNDKKEELKQKFGEAEFPQKYRLYKAVGAAGTVKVAYGIIFFVFVIAATIFGVAADERSDQQKMADAAREMEYERQIKERQKTNS